MWWKEKWIYFKLSKFYRGGIVGATNQNVSSGENGSSVTAVAFDGYYFDSWSDGVKTATREDKSIADNLSVQAIFKEKKYVDITYEATVGGFIEGNNAQRVLTGNNAAEVKAIALSGYQFTGWNDGLTTTNRTDENITSSLKFTANFEKIKNYNITYCASEGGFIEGNINQTILEGQSTTKVTAHPLEGYKFVSWSDGLTIPYRTDMSSGDVSTYTAIFEKKIESNIPVVMINTIDNQAIDSKEKYTDSTISITNTIDKYLIDNVKVGVKIRGNSTSVYSKKPFGIKFDKKQSLFGKEKNKSWVLLADYIDGSSLHNFTAFNLAKSFNNITYTPLAQHVRVYINGKYNGLYLLTEKVDEKAGRCDCITDWSFLDDGSENYNFLAELDASAPGDYDGVLNETYFKENIAGEDRYISIKYPEKEDFEEAITDKKEEELSNIGLSKSGIKEKLSTSEVKTEIENKTNTEYQRFFNYVKNYFASLGDACISGDYNQMNNIIDENSLIDMTLIDQLMGECDHSWKSYKFVKKAGEKLKIGPCWDYDWSLNTPWTGGISGYNNQILVYGNIRTNYNNFIPQNYFATTEGKAKIANRWNSIGNETVNNMILYLNQYSSFIQDELKYDADLWYGSDYDLIFRNIAGLQYYLSEEAKVLTEYYN